MAIISYFILGLILTIAADIAAPMNSSIEIDNILRRFIITMFWPFVLLILFIIFFFVGVGHVSSWIRSWRK